jgi:hypothetical protein
MLNHIVIIVRVFRTQNKIILLNPIIAFKFYNCICN